MWTGDDFGGCSLLYWPGLEISSQLQSNTVYIYARKIDTHVHEYRSTLFRDIYSVNMYMYMYVHVQCTRTCTSTLQFWKQF